MTSRFSQLPKEKQDMILEKALVEFGKYGYTSASTNRLVQALGISKGSLFKYFESKLDLYVSLVDDVVSNLEAYLESFTTNKISPKDRFIDYASFEYDFLVNKPIVYPFLYHLQKDLHIPELERVKVRLTQHATSLNSLIFSQIGIKDDPLFKQHLIFITTSYNQYFMLKLSPESDWTAMKTAYLQGLIHHLDLIRWEA